MWPKHELQRSEKQITRHRAGEHEWIRTQKDIPPNTGSLKKRVDTYVEYQGQNQPGPSVQGTAQRRGHGRAKPAELEVHREGQL
jgi:hypothetical protein